MNIVNELMFYKKTNYGKKIDIEILLERIEALESRLDKLDPVSKRKLPSKKDQISDIKNNLDEWAQKFPSADIEFELLKMLDWLQANQKRKKDYKAFLETGSEKHPTLLKKKFKMFIAIFMVVVPIRTANIKSLNTKIWLSFVTSVILRKDY